MELIVYAFILKVNMGWTIENRVQITCAAETNYGTNGHTDQQSSVHTDVESNVVFWDSHLPNCTFGQKELQIDFLSLIKDWDLY